jgi:hypothetical protein
LYLRGYQEERFEALDFDRRFHSIRGDPLLRFVPKLRQRQAEASGFAFSRPLVVLQSDGWGRVGVRDKEGYESLRSKGLRLGERPYDLYSLETMADVGALCDLLVKHRDSTNRPPCLVMNFCLANLDFRKMRQSGFGEIFLQPLSKGLPGHWSRPGLIESYRAGIRQGVFFPGLHGVTHFCEMAAEQALSENGERAQLLRLLWEEETPHIHWRMPWIGYEYWHPEKPHPGFIPAETQRGLVRQGYELFLALFGTTPTSACAPGCRSNRETHEAWSKYGIRVAQDSTASGLKAPSIDAKGILHLNRVIDFEPSQKEMEIDKYLEVARVCFSSGLPFVVSMPSINFHSSIKDFRTPSLAALDALLTALEGAYPELLYVNDSDVYSIVNGGAFQNRNEKVPVLVTRRKED